MNKEDLQVGKKVRVYDANKKDYVEGIVNQITDERFFLQITHDTILTEYIDVDQSFKTDYWLAKNRVELV